MSSFVTAFFPFLLVSILIMSSCGSAQQDNHQTDENRSAESEFSMRQLGFIDDPALPNPASGRLLRFHSTSAFVDARNVDVWLPPSYDGETPHRVLYMHDGQMLFDEDNTWNGLEWQVDEVGGRLMAEGRLEPFIVVGVWNNGDYRHAEYFPESAIAYLPATARAELQRRHLGAPRASRYLRFLTEELKPFVDETFTVIPDREATFIAGSSMGGLISMYALMQHPGLFAGAAALSTHWIGLFEQNEVFPEAFRRYMEGRLHLLTDHALYFDFGTVGLDSLYIPHQAVVDALLNEQAPEGLRHISLRFEGAEHNERWWAMRLHEPLLFLMGEEDTNTR